MTIKEMHTDVQSQVQRLSANRNRKLRPAEIDLYLNKAQLLMIDSAVTPLKDSSRFEVHRGKREVVANLLSGRITRPASWVTDKYITILPPDTWFLLDDGSNVRQLCTGDTNTVSYTILNITAVSFPKTTASADYYKDVEILYNNASLIKLSTEIADRQITWAGMDGTEEHFYIKDFLMNAMITRGIQVYWERFDNIYKPYHFLFVSDSIAVPVVVKLDGQEYTGTTEQRTLELHSSSRAARLSPNTMIAPDRSMSAGATPYFDTSYISPLSELGPGTITTYCTNSFIVSSTVINYIRKPRPISIILGNDCSLSETVHQQLCNMTAELILNRITAPEWKDQTEQNLLQKTQ